MVIVRKTFIRALIIIFLESLICNNKVAAVPSDKRMVESLAEAYPYVVALLNQTKQLACTGIIIGVRTVLTAGNCVVLEPQYIAVGTAVLGRNKKFNNKNIFEVAAAKKHSDYMYDLKKNEPNASKIHSNIGFVLAVRPVLEYFVDAVDIGTYLASELIGKKLTVVGYGELRSGIVTLQKQAYRQSPCFNPKWYYCVCAIEYSSYTSTYEHDFGKGAPVFLGSKVVGITAAPCGVLSLPLINVKYNIFTMISPYIPWIEQNEIETTKSLRTEIAFAKNGQLKLFGLFYICFILLNIIELFF